MGLMQSVLCVNTDYTKPIVTRVKNIHIVKKDRVRLLGIRCDIVYEIQLLELKPHHLDAKANVRPFNDTMNDDMRCWNVEHRTIFRTFKEMLDFFQSFEDNREVLDLAVVMKRLNFRKFSVVKDKITESCEYIDKALRLIASNPELYDSVNLKSFIANADCQIVPRVQKDFIETVTIPCGQSIDSFVKYWVSEVNDPKDLAKNIPWTKYLMLSMQDQLVEELASLMVICLLLLASPLIAGAIKRADSMFLIYGGFCYSCYNYGLRKGGKIAKGKANRMTIEDLPKKNCMPRSKERNDVLDLDIPGLRATFGASAKPIPSTRLCFYCCSEGREHPLEHFLRYPCCGNYICKACIKLGDCGECLTQLPVGNFYALQWIDANTNSTRLSWESDRRQHLISRLYIRGIHTFLDELILMPEYSYKKNDSSQILALLNPPNVQGGVEILENATKNNESIAMMLDLADAYCTIFNNDSFRPNLNKAEEWYIKALGKNESYSPMAFTHYGDFLMDNGRYDEAKSVYSVAAFGGHPRGEYEYAKFLLNETSTKEYDHENTEKALTVLCRSSKRGFHVPSYTLLVKTLVKTFETQYGTVYVTGKSPLPRILQILRLALRSEHFYGFSDHSIERRQWEKETLDLLKMYEESLTKCSKCGQKGTEENPLRFCEGCDKSVAYCSNICQRRDFRDGHKFDCCSPKYLFDFELLRLTLPWVSTRGSKRHENDPLPRLSSTTGRSLLQMVEDDTDEIYGEKDQDYDEAVLHNMMFRMRKNLETYLSKELNDFSYKNLHGKIVDFGKKYEANYSECKKFVEAMYNIKELGNTAVHYNDSSEEEKITKMKCENVVQWYRYEKEQFEKFKEQAKLFSNAQGEKNDVCNDYIGDGVFHSNDVTQESNEKNDADSTLVKKIPEGGDNLACNTDVTQTTISNNNNKKKKNRRNGQKKKRK